MSIMQNLGRRLTERADPVSLEDFGYLLANRDRSPSSSGVAVTEQQAMGLTTWYSGVLYLSTAVAYLPVKAYRRSGDERQKRPLPTWLERPDKHLSRGLLIEQWMTALLNRGNAFSFKLRDSVGRVVGARPLHNDRVSVFQDPRSGDKRFEVKMGDGSVEIFTEHEILHLVGPFVDGVVGKSPIRQHSEALGIAVAQNTFAGRYYRNGTLIRDYVEVPAENRQKPSEVKEAVEDFHQGLDNAHRLAVLRGAQYKTVDLKADDAQLLESRQWSVIEMAQILRIPPHKLYELSRATFSNIEHQAIEAVMDSVRPWVSRLEDQINFDRSLVTGSDFLEFSLEGMLRGDTQTRYAAYHQAIQDGWMELSEPRRKENLPPRPGMDVVYRPANVNVVDTATGQILIPSGKPSESAADSTDETPEEIPDVTPEDVARTLRAVP